MQRAGRGRGSCDCSCATPHEVPAGQWPRVQAGPFAARSWARRCSRPRRVGMCSATDQIVIDAARSEQREQVSADTEARCWCAHTRRPLIPPHAPRASWPWRFTYIAARRRRRGRWIKTGDSRSRVTRPRFGSSLSQCLHVMFRPTDEDLQSQSRRGAVRQITDALGLCPAV